MSHTPPPLLQSLRAGFVFVFVSIANPLSELLLAMEKHPIQSSLGFQFHGFLSSVYASRRPKVSSVTRLVVNDFFAEDKIMASNK